MGSPRASESSTTCCSWDISVGDLHWPMSLPQHVAAGTCLQGGLHPPTSLPQHVARICVQDALASLSLSPGRREGGERTRLATQRRRMLARSVLDQTCVPKTERQRYDLIFSVEDVVVVLLRP